MLDRRRFTFGMLLASVSAPAVASRGQGALVARYEVSQQADVLEVRLFLANQGTAPMDVMAKVGSRPGPSLRVHRVGAPEGEELAQIVTYDRSELVSRVGPRPTYLTLAANGKETEIATYRFAVPEGPAGAVELALTVPGMDDSVAVPTQRVEVAETPQGKVGT